MSLNFARIHERGEEIAVRKSFGASGRLEYDKKQSIGLSDGQKFLCRKLYFMDSGFRHPFYLIEEFTEEIRKAEKLPMES